MKVYDSGMPEESYWNSLFDVGAIVSWVRVAGEIAPIVEVGCGYGTFTVPIASEVVGKVHAFDIDPEMIEKARSNVRSAGLTNVEFYERDVAETGTGLPDASVRTVLLFNILHSKESRLLLKESSRILEMSGSAFILHWRKDIATPRGPNPDSRPDLQIILDQVRDLDLSFSGNVQTIEPYHWGMQLIRGRTNAHRNSA